MKRIQILTLLIINIGLFAFVSAHQEYKKLLFESQIEPDNSSTKIQIFDIQTKDFKKTLIIELINEEKSVFTDTLIIEMDDEPLIDLVEINGDGIKDLRIEYLRPGRGGNNVSMVYLCDMKNLQLNKLSNSIYFPNLTFDEELKFVSSFRFYGGFAVQMDYLEIVSDTLSPKHRIIKEEQMIYVEKNVEGKWIKRKELKLESDDIVIPEIIELEPEIKIKNAS